MTHRSRELTEAEVHFCTLVAKGDTAIKDCLVAAFPKKYRGKSENTVKTQAKRLVARPDIAARVARIREDTGARIEDRYAGLKDEMVDRLVKGIREGTDADALSVVEFTKCIDLLAKMGGWYAPTDVTVRNGGVSADYRPPTLMEMSDGEISAKLAALRGAGDE